MKFKPRFTERRHYRRKDIYCFIKYGFPHTTITSIRNISGGGILFKAHEYLPIGTQLEITISIPPIENPITILVEVVRVERIKNANKYWVGVKFLDIKEEDREAIVKIAGSNE
jgi:c-di-GMP-binding flagellar brake protein YcgR